MSDSGQATSLDATSVKKKSSKPIGPIRSWQTLFLGISAVGFLIAGAVVMLLPGTESNSQSYFSGTLLKVGVVLGLGWLAAPQLERLGWQRIRGSMLIAIIVVLVAFVIKPRFGAWAGAILIVGSIFFGLLGWFRNLTDSTKRS